MMRRKRICCLLLALILLFSLAACTDKPFSPGDTLTAEELAALQNALKEKEEEKEKEEQKKDEDQQKEEEKKEEDVPADAPTGGEEEKENEQSGEDAETPTVSTGTVFWLQSGSVYHSSAACSYLKDKENVQSGTAEEAAAEGKERLCSRCGKH